MTDAKTSVMDAIHSVTGPGDEITEETQLVDFADSLDIIEIVMDLEEKLDIEIDDAQVEALNTVADLVKLVESDAGPKEELV